MKNILSEQEIDGFLTQIKNIFPNFVASVVCDNNGFPIAAKVPKNFHIHENIMALSALTEDRELIKDTGLMKVRRDVGGSKNVKLFLLLEKTNKYVNRFKALSSILRTQSLF